MDISIYLKRKDIRLGFKTSQILQDLMSNLLCQCQPQVNLDDNAGRLSLIYY